MHLPLSRIRQFLLGIGAIALALAAQQFINQHANTLAILCYACASVLAIITFRQSGQKAVVTSDPEVFELGGNQQSISVWIGIALIGLAVIVSSATLWQMDELTPTAVDWWLYLLSLLLMLVGAYLCDGLPFWPRGTRSKSIADDAKSERSAWRRYEVPLLLLLIFGIGVFFRLFHLSSLPFGTWYDEAEYALQAMRIQAEPGFRPVFSSTINGPAHYLYLVALSFDLFGVSTQAVRAVNVALGLLTILAGYGVGKELFDRRIGLVVAFLLAVSGWDVMLSRFGMHSTSTTPLFTLLTAYFLLRSLRTRRISDFAWSGFWLGIGLCFYTSFRLFVPAIALFIGYYLLYNWLKKSLSSGRKLLVGCFIIGLSAWLAVAPVAIFALRQPTIFWERVQKTYIFADKSPEERIPVLLKSVKQHLLMFNVEGDPNGRHNIPGEPMLDSITGALFVLGVALALWRISNPIYLLLLVWCGFSLIGGILSIDFEAPQSLRSNGALTAAYLLAALPIYELWRAWDRGARFYSRLLAWPLLLLLALIGYINYDFYFNRYANDFAAWNAWSTPETLAANLLNQLPPNTVPYLTNYFEGSPSIQFITQGKTYKDIKTTDHLPLDWPQDKDVELMLNLDSRNIYDEAHQLYPNATFEEITPPFPGPVTLFRVHLTQDDIRSIQGLVANYYANDTWSGDPVLTRKDLQIDTDWSGATPLPLPFSVEWTGVLHVNTYGIHQFFVRAPKQVELYIGEEQVFAGEGELSAGVVLASGNHSVRLRMVGGPGPVNLSWMPPKADVTTVPISVLMSGPVRANGLLGKFYANADWQGDAAFARIDPDLDLYFHIIPLPRPYTVEWSGKIAIPTSGDYGFGLESISESTLFIDSQQILAATTGNRQENTHLNLEQGLHDIRVRFADHEDHSHIHLFWTPPGYGQQPIPSAVLFPPQGNYERVQVPELAQLYFTQPVPTPNIVQPGVLEPLLAQVNVFPVQLNAPFGIAAGVDGRIYVADTGNKRLVILNNDGTELSEVTAAETPFTEPFDVATDSSGQVYLLDATTGRVAVFDGNGGYLRTIPVPQGAPERSRGLFVDQNANVWIAHTSGSRVLATDAQGNLIMNINLQDQEAAQPIDVAVGANGTIFVSDGDRHKLMVFTAQGNLVLSLELEPANTLSGPHLAMDQLGFVYMTAPESGRVIKYAPDGQQMGYYDLRSAGVARPVGVSVDPMGKIWVVDVDLGHVAVITPPDAIQPTSPLAAPSEGQPESPLSTP